MWTHGREDLSELTKAASKEWLSGPDNPVLVSYPRCGRYWLTFLMEAYFGKSCNYVDSRYVTDSVRIILPYHAMSLGACPRNLIYLYRKDVVNVVFSWVSLGDFLVEEDVTIAPETIAEKAEEYAKHLNYYLSNEDCSVHKLIISYEDLVSSPSQMFSSVCEFFSQPFDAKRFDSVYSELTPAVVSELSDEIQLGGGFRGIEYEARRVEFGLEFGNRISEIFTERCPHMKEKFGLRF